MVGRRRSLLTGLVAGVLGVVLLIVGSAMPLTQATSFAVSDWGLSFRTKGQPPVGNVSSETLSQYDAAFVGDTTQKTIYLTFDAGYENGYTPAILDTLKQHGVTATFFVVGNYLETAPELIQRMVAEGHTVGNHTYHHPDMSRIADKASFQKELTALEEKYRAITGQELPKLYRPPQGKFSEQNLMQAKELGYRTYFWSLAYVDWYVDKQPTREEAMTKLTERIHNGAIVLLHSTSKTNSEVLSDVIAAWKAAGYTFGKLSDLSGLQS